MINYCQNITCLNNGICQPLLLNYSCLCLGDSYSGRHCEITSTKTEVYQKISKSFAYIAIIAILCFAMLIVIMDVLKYFFHIEPTYKQLKKDKQKKKKKKVKSPVISRLIFVHVLTTQPSRQAIATVQAAV